MPFKPIFLSKYSGTLSRLDFLDLLSYKAGMMDRNREHIDRRLSVAPMMDWTDRHCRYFLRLVVPDALLFTEMVTADAIIHGDRERLLGHDLAEHPLALQLGGSDPEKLAQAAKIAMDYGFAEINLNVGCPSDRVQSGRFGACLMAEPALVAECCDAMASVTAALDVPVSVKCRIGIDDMDAESGLDSFTRAVADAGVTLLYVHARKAWLKGLSPKENRDIPPLDYDRVKRLVAAFPDIDIHINGGIVALDTARELAPHFAGMMLARAPIKPRCLWRRSLLIYMVLTFQTVLISLLIWLITPMSKPLMVCRFMPLPVICLAFITASVVPSSGGVA